MAFQSTLSFFIFDSFSMYSDLFSWGKKKEKEGSKKREREREQMTRQRPRVPPQRTR
jgi:hypothetical protein